MTEYTLQALKNRITDRIHENRSRSITGIDLQEILHDMIDSLVGQAGGDPGVSENGASEYGLVGDVDGVNKSFSTSINFLAGSTKIYLNGIRQFLGEDYTEEGGSTILFTQAPQVDDLIIADYKY